MSRILSYLLRGVLWAVLYVLALIPQWKIHFLADAVSQMLRQFANKSTDLIHWNIEACFRLARHSSFAKTFVHQVYRNQLIIALETCKAIVFPSRVRIDNLQLLKDTLARLQLQGKAGIFATAHLGSWELAARALATCGNRQVHVLAKPAKVAAFDQLLSLLRAKAGVKVLWTNRASLGKSMLGVLQRHEILGVVMDQKPLARQGHQVDFFGMQTEFVSGPATLAIRYKVPLFGIYVMRIGPCHYRLFLNEIYRGEEVGLADGELSQRCAADIEAMIRRYPEQWVWNYKRWRHYKRFLPYMDDSALLMQAH